MRTTLQRIATLATFMVALAIPTIQAAPSPAAPSTADKKFEALGKRYLAEFGRYRRFHATCLGDHRYDGELDDVGADGRARARAWNRGARGAAGHRPQVAAREPGRRRDARNRLRYSIWSEQKYRDWSWDPLVYTQLSGQALYGLLAREFAPLPERLRSLASRLEKLPAFLEQRARISSGRACPRSTPDRHEAEPRRAEPRRQLVVPNLGTLPGGRPRAPQGGHRQARAAVQAHQKWLESELEPKARASSASAASSMTRSSPLR